jgi:hypothetical protein
MKFKFLIAILLMSFTVKAQVGQTIRGTIVDQDAKTPLSGVTIQLIGSAGALGAISDDDGKFRIDNVPVGRVTLKIFYVGYQDRSLTHLLLTSGKEMILRIDLQESVAGLKETVVTGRKNKKQVLNEMALISSRAFTVEETKRYAGSIDDPARLVSAFAGVNIHAEGNNDIIVRGNSSKGILWRLEGMEIPNPNHFANEGSTGGPINALNSNMLGNSDFLTGAFSPEYGNAISGVFDMKLRSGNNEKREYTATASVLGMDVAVEGPFSKNYNGSYLFNYRYSTLDLMSSTGIVDFGGVPRYQDLTFKLNLPLGSKQKITAYGLGGLSAIDQEVLSEVPEENERPLLVSGMNAGLGIAGVSHAYQFNSRIYLKTNLQVSKTLSRGYASISNEQHQLYEVANDNFIMNSVKASSTINIKMDSKNKLKAGFIVDRKSYHLSSEYWSSITNQLEGTIGDDGKAYHMQTFATWKHRINEDVTLVGGLHHLYFFLNESNSLEPRLAVKWNTSNRHSFNAGFGLHSKLEAMSIYLGQEQLNDGTYVQNNTDLGLMKAAHFVAGYQYAVSTNTTLKSDLFYQHLYDVPIENVSGSQFSLLNQAAGFTTHKLVNDGVGRNYGIELTLERNLDKGFYYLTTLSIYQSLFTPFDGIERQTRFAGNHVFNLLGGKEFKVGVPSKNKTLFVNIKTAWIGGGWYTPIDLEASIVKGDEVRHWDQPYSVASDDIIKIDLSIGVRRNRSKYFSEWKIDIQNISNNQAVVNEYYVHEKKAIVNGYQLGLFPVISYKWQF